MATPRHLPPTPARLARDFESLATALSVDTSADHSITIVTLARQAEALGLPAATIEALLDPTSAPVVRERAASNLSMAAARSHIPGAPNPRRTWLSPSATTRLAPSTLR